MDLTRAGSLWLKRWTDAALALRARLGDDRLVDIDYRELAREPLAWGRRIHRRFGSPFPPEAGTAMRRWLRDDPRRKHGVPEHTPVRFGLTEEEGWPAASSASAGSGFGPPREETERRAESLHPDGKNSCRIKSD